MLRFLLKWGYVSWKFECSKYNSPYMLNQTLTNVVLNNILIPTLPILILCFVQLGIKTNNVNYNFTLSKTISLTTCLASIQSQHIFVLIKKVASSKIHSSSCINTHPNLNSCNINSNWALHICWTFQTQWLHITLERLGSCSPTTGLEILDILMRRMLPLWVARVISDIRFGDSNFGIKFKGL